MTQAATEESFGTTHEERSRQSARLVRHYGLHKALIDLSTLHAIMMIAINVILLTAVDWLINRALGVPVPVWSSHTGGT